MSGDERRDPISTQAEFEAALAAVVDAAVRGEVDVRGSWVFEAGEQGANWDVEIYELADADAGEH
jgi:hypothetical protein